MRKIAVLALSAGVGGLLLFNSALVGAQGNAPDRYQPDRVREQMETRTTTAQERREEAQMRLDAQRGRVRTRVEKRAATRSAAREEFHKRVREIRDERRAHRLELFTDRLNFINQRWTNHFLLVLDRLQTILNKLADRGANTAEAQAAIDLAYDTATAQANKDYVPDLDDETLPAAARDAVSLLHADLRELRAQIMDTRQAVIHVLRTLQSEPTKTPVE